MRHAIHIWPWQPGSLEGADHDCGRPGGHVGPHDLLNVIKLVEFGRKLCIAMPLGAIGSFHYQVKAT